MRTRGEIQNEAENHIALGLLLRKDRAEPRKSAVHKVLAHPISLAQKIEAIKRIDEKTDVAGVLQVVQDASARVARNHAGRISLLIKKEIPTRSYFRFLLTDFQAVQRFGRRSYVLDVRLLPPGMRLDAHLADFLAKKVYALAKELTVCLMPVAAYGWLYLTPKQYNLLVLVKRLADRVQVFDFSRLDFRSPRTIDRLRRIESLFLMLHHDPKTLQIIFDALRVYFEHHHDSAKHGKQTFGLVLQLLAEDCTVPSLYNCLLGLNMFKHRRVLALKDLIREGLGEMVDVNRFDFDSGVRVRVDRLINDTLESVKLLHGQLMDARRTNSYVTLGAQGRPDMADLKELYESGAGQSSFSFTGDQENLVLFVFRLLRSFDRVFSPLLNGQCLLEEQGRVALFSTSFFALDFTKLRTLAERLEQQLFRFARFPLTRYLQIKGGRLQAIGQEMEVSQLMGQGVVCLADIGRTIMKVLSLSSPTQGDSRDAFEPVILHGRSFSVPHENRRIQAKSLLNGLTVAQALFKAVAVCFSAGMLLEDEFVSVFLSREKRLVIEFRRRMAFLQNLLDPESYKELSALYT